MEVLLYTNKIALDYYYTGFEQQKPRKIAKKKREAHAIISSTWMARVHYEKGKGEMWRDVKARKNQGIHS